jgi:hypothetical protein
VSPPAISWMHEEHQSDADAGARVHSKVLEQT